jgi:hypothetical protein
LFFAFLWHNEVSQLGDKERPGKKKVTTGGTPASLSSVDNVFSFFRPASGSYTACLVSFPSLSFSLLSLLPSFLRLLFLFACGVLLVLLEKHGTFELTG